jgi:hypothetical protein
VIWAAYTTVSTVCSSALLGGLVDLDVLNDQVASIEAFGISVGLGILEQSEEELGRLGGPSCAGDTELLSYRHLISTCSRPDTVSIRSLSFY